MEYKETKYIFAPQFKKPLSRLLVLKKDSNTKIYFGVEQLVARWAHNPKVIGSSPVPATEDDGNRKFLLPFFISTSKLPDKSSVRKKRNLFFWLDKSFLKGPIIYHQEIQVLVFSFEFQNLQNPNIY